MVSIREYNFPPTYLRENGQKRDFQAEMEAFSLDKSSKICILDAPTGSGKTYGFKLMSQLEGFTLIVLPNNLLAKEVFDNFKKDISVALLTGPEIKKFMDLQISRGFTDFTKRKAVGQIINNNKIIITNPTVFYYIILNFYFYKLKDYEEKNKRTLRGDHLSQLISQGLRMIIFDEFHVYSRDQRYIIFSMISSFREDIKVMFSSATLPTYLGEISEDLFGKANVKYITVKREFLKTANSHIVQGPIRLNICSGIEISEFIEKYHSFLDNGNWFIIADSLRNIDKIFKSLLKFFPKEEIMRVSAYHDPEYNGYMELEHDSGKKRFVIGSNIIEQGINPPKEYYNFILEPGLGVENLIQRIGRVGRGADFTSTIYVIIRPEINEVPEMTTIEDFYKFIQNFNGKDSGNRTFFIKKYIGAYIGAITENLSFGLKTTIIANLKGNKNMERILPFLYAYSNISKKLNDETSPSTRLLRRDIREINDIILWWKSYSNSIKRFIPSNDKVELLDISPEDEGFRTVYDKIWVRRNKEIIKDDNGFWVIVGFLDKPYNDFEVKVKGVPFIQRRFDYSDISPYRAREKIIKAYKEWKERNSYPISSTDDLKRLFDDIEMVLEATADFERLEIETID
jgi:CRISPR-associated endonuclease/helicase Cas3